MHCMQGTLTIEYTVLVNQNSARGLFNGRRLWHYWAVFLICTFSFYSSFTNLKYKSELTIYDKRIENMLKSLFKRDWICIEALLRQLIYNCLPSIKLRIIEQVSPIYGYWVEAPGIVPIGGLSLWLHTLQSSVAGWSRGIPQLATSFISGLLC